MLCVAKEIESRLAAATEEELYKKGADGIRSEVLRRRTLDLFGRLRYQAGNPSHATIERDMVELGLKHRDDSVLAKYEIGKISGDFSLGLFLGLGWIYCAWGNPEYEEIREHYGYGTDKQHWPQCIAEMHKASKRVSHQAYLDYGRLILFQIISYRRVENPET